MDYRDEMEINLIDLLYHILKKWRVLLAFILLGVILGGIYSIAHYNKIVAKQTENAALNSTEQETLSISEIEEVPLDNNFVLNRNNLTEAEISIANNCINDYLTFYENYLNVVEFGKKSIYLKLNSNRVPTMVNSYLIEGYYKYVSEDGELVSNINNIIGVYDKLLSGSDVINRILDETKWDVDQAQVRELYKIALKDDSLMTITVVSDNWNNCQKIMNILDEYVVEYTKQVKNLYDYSIDFAGQTYSEYVDDNVYGAQQTQTSKVNTIRNNMNNASATLNDFQKVYYSAVIKKINDYVGDDISKLAEVDITSIVQELEDEPVETVTTTEENTEVTVQEEKKDEEVVKMWDLKYLILGLIIAIIIFCLIVSAVYVLSPFLKTKDDLYSVFNVMVFGQLFIEKSNKYRHFTKIDSLIDNTFLEDYTQYNENDALRFISSELDLSLKTNNAKEIYIARCIYGAQAEVIVQKLCALFAEAGIGVSGIGNITRSAKAVNDLNLADYVLLVGQVGATKYDDIEKEIALCNKCNKKILGAVVIN